MSISRHNIRLLWRTIIEFGMLKPYDRVLVGLSGGKDSSFLIYALSELRKNAPFSFDAAAVHVDLGFEESFDAGPLEEYCERLQVPFYLKHTRISHAAFSHKRQNPCAQCAFLRRGVMNRLAVEQGFNKVALAHHLDDAVETFLMSLLYSGQLKTFQPCSYLARTDLTVIRPLIYFREKEIQNACMKIEYKPVDTPCPMAGKTMRAMVKKLVRQLVDENRYIFHNLTVAMREGVEITQWPSAMSKESLRHKVFDFWSGNWQELQ
jgi:tRNA(Ile)-lysidine synthetase-like protein